jgi:glycine/D-amino acid oxidase-like deaminating enzyme
LEAGFVFNARWGNPPWTIDFRPAHTLIPQEVDFAIVGGGFTGLSAAAWLRRMEPRKSVALFESGLIGAGSSGHTGGMALTETSAGDLPGLGDVLAGFSSILNDLAIQCDLSLPGVWEVARSGALPTSAISWRDSGEIRVVREVPGGTIDPGKLVSGLGRAAEGNGAQIFENAAVDGITFEEPLFLLVAGGKVRAHGVLLATNAMSLELTELSRRSQPKFTLAVATKPLSSSQFRDLGWKSGTPFYTIDFPYLWGRPLRDGGVVFGSGLVHLKDWREFAQIDVTDGQAAELIASLEGRVRGLHPSLKNVEFTHRWGGPILIANAWRPVFSRHPHNPHAIVLGGYCGHGVAQSVYLGRWAAEAMCGRRSLPDWDSLGPGEPLPWP